jgi:transposase InsO family protein
MATSMVLDAIEQAIWTRQQEGILDLKAVVHQTDRGSQYTSIRFSERLAEAGIQPSVGAVDSSYDNALAESINGLYKTELIRSRRPWRTIEEVELATAEWVHWFSVSAASTSTAATYRRSNWRPPITLDTGVQPPAEFCDQKVAAVKYPSVTASAPTTARFLSGLDA